MQTLQVILTDHTAIARMASAEIPVEKNPLLAYFSHHLQSKIEVNLISSLSMINHCVQVLIPSQGHKEKDNNLLVQIIRTQYF